jgi:parallel beta-helix repeat protein
MFIHTQPSTHLIFRGLAPLLVLALVLFTGCTDDAVAPEDITMSDLLTALDVEPDDLEGTDMAALEASIDAEAFTHAVRDSETDDPPERGRSVQFVRPGDSIQEAIDAVAEGGFVFVRPGVYVDSLVINKSLHLVGLGRPGGVVIRDPGGGQNGIFARGVRGLSLINFKVEGFASNGVFLIDVNGFLIHRLRTDQLGVGAYGLFPVRSRNGLITHCTATGADDSGIYVGQSENVAVVRNEAFGNVIGLEAENVRRTAWARNTAYDNAAGMLAILLPEGGYVQITHADRLYVAHNDFSDNNGENFAPGGLAAAVPSGTGLLVFGYDDSEITRNDVTGNQFVGIGLASAVTLLAAAGRFEDLPLLATIEQGPHPDNVRIVDNEVPDNGFGAPLEVTLPDGSTIPVPAADLIWDKPIIDLLGMDPDFPFGEYGEGNCWADNTYETSFPDSLPSCDGGA